jgi:hypothetical protein
MMSSTSRSFFCRHLRSYHTAITASSVSSVSSSPASAPSAACVLLRTTTRIQLQPSSFNFTNSNIRRNLSDETKKPTVETVHKENEEPSLNISVDLENEETKEGDTSTSASASEINIEDYTQELIIPLPDVGADNLSGKVVKWYKAEGDIVRPNDTICDIQTDLFTFGMDVEDENEGIMKSILVQVGEEGHKPGTPLCIIMHKPMN